MSTTLTYRDFETSQEVRWCPGCGDYANHPTGFKRTARVQDVISAKNTWRVE